MNRADDSSEMEVCNPCFFFKSPLRSKDPIGSPMPDTPLHHRRKRNEYLLEERRNNPIFSSKYLGLEKEVEPPVELSKENEYMADVYEGKVSSCMLLPLLPLFYNLTLLLQRMPKRKCRKSTN